MRNNDKSYENYIMLTAPIINSVAGIAIDLYAPSIPSIGYEMGASASLMQNTITITLIFYAIGQLFFGVMADTIGRRQSIRLGLILFIVGSFLAATANNINELLFSRGLQGFSIGACQIVARAILVDNIKGPRFSIAIVYLSLAFGVGPVIAPYIGGIIEVSLGWRYNFYAYVLYGAMVFILSIRLKESLNFENKRTVYDTILGYKEILSDKKFITCVLILGTSFSSFLIWNVIGPYIVQEKMGYSSDIFGKTALLVGLSYLSGTLLNRTLIKRLKQEFLFYIGFSLSVIGVVVMLSLNPFLSLHLPTLLGGIMIYSFGQGFVFSNAMARAMSLFPNRAGVSASLQGCIMIIIGSLTSFIVSLFDIFNNATVAFIFLVLFSVAILNFIFNTIEFRRSI